MSSQLRALEAYVDLVNRNGAAHAFRAAMRCGLFAALAEGQKTAAQLAEVCQLQLGPTELLLDALRALGAVERYGDDYALAPVVRLLTDHDRDQGDRYWDELESFLKTGESLEQRQADSGHAAGFRAEQVATEWLRTPAALALTEVLGIGQERQGLRILDLGAGAAVFSLTLAHRDPAAVVTAIDHAALLAQAAHTAQDIGLGDRFHAVDGDFRHCQLPAAAFDLVLVANLLQVESEEAAQSLLARARDALVAGGELAVIDVFPGQQQGELYRSLYALQLAIRRQHGDLFTPQALEQLLLDAGFDKPQYAHLPDPPFVYGVVLARKPARTDSSCE